MFKILNVALFTLLYCKQLFAYKYVNITDFTYHASVRRSGWHVCSGAVVHDSWIITAASCVYDSSVPEISVILGSTDLNAGHIYHIVKIIPHQTFNKALLTNNVAMLKTSDYLISSRGPKILPIFLPSSENYHLKDGRMLVVSGWRRLKTVEYQEKKPSTLKFESQLSVTGVPLVNQRACIHSMPSYKVVSGKKILCAGYTYPNTNETCQGDVGAPLVNGDVLVGILSSGDECIASSRPAVFTKVSSYLPWILRIIELDRYD